MRDPDGGNAVSGGHLVENRFEVEAVAKGDVATSVVVLAASDRRRMWHCRVFSMVIGATRWILPERVGVSSPRALRCHA